MAKLFFIGDSITVGAWDTQGGWANRLCARVMEETIAADFAEDDFYCLPYNLGVSGDIVPDILARLDGEVKARLDLDNPHEAVEFVISIGVNDSQLVDNKPRFTDAEFAANLQNLIEIASRLAQRISFAGLVPVDDDKLNPIPWAPKKAYQSERVKIFENIISEICSKHSMPFLPIFDTWFSMKDYKDHLVDGVHPNTKGHALLAQQIGKFIITDEFRTFHTEKHD